MRQYGNTQVTLSPPSLLSSSFKPLQLPVFQTGFFKTKKRNFAGFKILCILCLFPYSTIFSQECGTIAPTYDILSGYPSQKKTGNDGPYYIKIYPVIVRETNGSDGATEAQVLNALEEMKNDFKAFNIFFYTACIRYWDDSDAYLDPETALANYDELEDGISLLLYDQILTGNIVGKSGIPGRKLFAKVESTKTLTHEMGHALGLYHTHNGSSCANGGSANELVDESNCTTAGDYICETKAAPDFAALTTGVNYGACTYTNTTCVDPSGHPYVNADMKNIMSYGSICRDYFVSEQGEKMRNTLALDAELADVQRNWAYVKGTVTIEDPKYADIDVIVTQGATLNFNDLLEMAPERRIVVEKQGRFNTNGATITVGASDENCPTDDPFWGGIFLSSGAYYEYAKATILNSIIENAKTAITWLKPVYNVMNGRVWVTNTHFLNNQTAIHFFLEYSNIVQPNFNPFSNCNFEIDDDFLGEVFDEQINLVNCANSITLFDCKIANNRTTTLPGKNYGVNTYSSRFQMVDDNSTSQQSEISNFEVGINSFRGVTYSPTILARNIHFTNNKNGINSRAINNLVANDCFFNIADNSSGFAGIAINSGTGYMIHDNEFTSSGATRANKYGTRLFNTSSESNMIDNNIFENMGDANIASGINGGSLSGLQYLCNTVTNSNQHDFYVGSGSSIAKSQGNSIKPAGNKFSQHTSPSGSDFYNNSTNDQIAYFFYFADPTQVPKNTLNLTTISRERLPCEPGRIREMSLLSLDTLYEVTRTEYDSIEDLYQGTSNFTLKDERASLLRLVDTKLMVICNSALFLINNDTSSINWTGVRTWLSRKNSFAGDIDIATTYLSEDDESGFTSFRSTIPGRRSLTPEDSTDYELFVDLTDLLLTAKADERSEADLDASELSILDDVAESNGRMIAGMAKNILETFYGYTFLDTITPRSIKVVSLPIQTNPVKIVPQPASNIVMLNFPIGRNEIKISSVTGEEIFHYTCQDCSTYEWDSSRLPSGVYYYIVISSSGTYSGTIVKNN